MATEKTERRETGDRCAFKPPIGWFNREIGRTDIFRSSEDPVGRTREMLFPDMWVISPQNCLSPDSNDLYRQHAKHRNQTPYILPVTGSPPDYSPKVGFCLAFRMPFGGKAASRRAEAAEDIAAVLGELKTPPLRSCLRRCKHGL